MPVKKDKKERLEDNLYKWLDSVELVEEDIETLLNYKNIAKSKIAKDVDIMKQKLRTVEDLIKRYR